MMLSLREGIWMLWVERRTPRPAPRSGSANAGHPEQFSRAPRRRNATSSTD